MRTFIALTIFCILISLENSGYINIGLGFILIGAAGGICFNQDIREINR
jgi:hypothetical protein